MNSLGASLLQQLAQILPLKKKKKAQIHSRLLLLSHKPHLVRKVCQKHIQGLESYHFCHYCCGPTNFISNVDYFFSKIYLFMSERESVPACSGEGQREMERGNQAAFLLSAESDRGLDPITLTSGSLLLKRRILQMTLRVKSKFVEGLKALYILDPQSPSYGIFKKKYQMIYCTSLAIEG